MTVKQLRAALKRCNLSELSRRSGVNIRTLRRILNSDQAPRPETLKCIEFHIEGSRRA